MSGKKSVINWPATASLLNACTKGLQHVTVTHKVPGEIKRFRGGRWNWTFKLAQKRSWVRRWSWAAKAGLLSSCSSTAVQRTLFLWLPKHGSWNSNCAVHKSLGNGEGTLPLFWRWYTVSPVFSAVSAVEPSLFRPPPPPPPPTPSLISHLASVNVKQNGQLLLTSKTYLWTTSRVLLTRVAQQEPKLLIWLHLSTRLVNRQRQS